MMMSYFDPEKLLKKNLSEASNVAWESFYALKLKPKTKKRSGNNKVTNAHL